MKNSGQLIDKFLLGQLKGAALQAFQKQLELDPALAQEVAQRKSVLGVVDAFGDIEMQKRIGRIHAEETERLGRRVQLRRWLSAAAGVILICGIGIWFWSQPQNAASLFDTHYQAYALNFSARSGEPASLDDLNQLYQTKQYGQALLLLKALYTTDSSQSKIGLAIGICLIEEGQYQAALQHFSTIKNKSFDLYQDHAFWYSALLQLRLDQPQEAKKELEVLIKKPQSYFYQQAKKLHAQI